MHFLKVAVTMLTAAVLVASCGSAPETAPSDGIHVSCLAEPDPGPCRAAKPGFYYDYRSDTCNRFIYGGCAGKLPFATMEECLQTCGGRPGR
jgi:hypothetical protein